MIVYIYQKLSHKLHNYENPSLDNKIGFNITHLTSNGYFVLLPDIKYEIGNTGVSATDCVTGAVKYVTGNGRVDPAKIGLVGHSFGSYETNIIVSQTNLFAAAISGCGSSDIIWNYLSIHENMGNADAWRFENQQYRMGVSFYANKDAYYRNSPIHNADKIQTPILIWTGKEDNNVRPEQSRALHIALRRLKKEHILLQYPGEGHVLASPDAQKDLTQKHLEWFNYYLKGEKPADWIVKGSQ